MSQPSETTRLLPRQDVPVYVYDRDRKRRVKQFQCCLCTMFLFCFVAAMVAVLSWSISADIEDALDGDNETQTENTNSNNLTQALVDSKLILLSIQWPRKDKNITSIHHKNITVLHDAFIAGKMQLQAMENIEKNINELDMNSPSYRHQKATATSEKAMELSKIGHIEEFAYKYLHRMNATPALGLICNENITEYLSEICDNTKIECDKLQKYRNYNGSCNNLNHPKTFGAAYTPFRRALPADYEDGISSPRNSRLMDKLPSARTVSLTVHRPYYRDDPKFSVMLAVWGQFLDHDITATALTKGANGKSISCCNQSIEHPACFPVLLDQGDPLKDYNISCIEFVRSSPAATCCLGSRQQLTQVSAFIDGSVIYGADVNVVKNLRSFDQGFLKMYFTEDNRTLLPISDDLSDGCNREEQRKNGKYCFLTGDARANENFHLTSMHLIWARHHNLIAKNLSHINPHWEDEKVFQETRRIVGAQMQHITYHEFLPILLGPQIMKKFKLYPQKNGYFKRYNDTIDPTIANNFATAAFRFAHSIIPGIMKLLANDTSSPEYVQLHKMLFDPFKLYEPGELDRAIRGAMNTDIEASDTYFTHEVKDHLFQQNDNRSTKNSPKKCGLDLVSLNIQRGRDHGLPSYPNWREYCGLKRPESFNDLRNDIDEDSLSNIQTIYGTIDDVDLYTAAVSEKPIKGGIIGPTFTCLILDQFIRLKYGDRYWYETPDYPLAFSEQQLNELRKTTLASILCDNADDLQHAQPFVMEKVNKKENKIMNCSEISKPNLEEWFEQEQVTPVSIN